MFEIPGWPPPQRAHRSNLSEDLSSCFSRSFSRHTLRANRCSGSKVTCFAGIYSLQSLFFDSLIPAIVATFAREARDFEIVIFRRILPACSVARNILWRFHTSGFEHDRSHQEFVLGSPKGDIRKLIYINDRQQFPIMYVVIAFRR